ncbi:nuclear transport factor 2 family protein [Ferruginibacter lapsinanis]|uniref:ester cyclase n=1 Tax=Ferruginibacter lapsinanis TaxID=563172 RepID=UPI001E31C6E6|nr:nuclear transport factor 2 family protein [Ferruginibacter lapsinanis]UEG49651.1 nuclear transport factor 2 family protein [Ferruginibacter lapsinanis]
MKKLFFLSLLITIIGASCKNEGGMSATAKKNMEVNEAIMKAYEAGDFGKMGDYIAVDAVDHGGEHGDVKGLDSIVSEMKRYHAQMPDMKTKMSKSLADDEYVFTWSTITGSSMGKPTSMSSVDVSKFKDGKAVEHWIFMDPKEMMMMMQSMPPMAVDTANHVVTDSLKK